MGLKLLINYNRIVAFFLRNMAWRSHGSSNNDLYDQLKRNGVLTSARVEEALRRVDRGKYSKSNPFMDSPQPIGWQATISAPHMHCYALQLLEDQLHEGATALDVGSGSGYLTAAMAYMVGETGKVYGIDHMEQLVNDSTANVKRGNPELINDKRIELIVGDGRKGYEPGAPYDAIHVGAAAPNLPQARDDAIKDLNEEWKRFKSQKLIELQQRDGRLGNRQDNDNDCEISSSEGNETDSDDYPPSGVDKDEEDSEYEESENNSKGSEENDDDKLSTAQSTSSCNNQQWREKEKSQIASHQEKSTNLSKGKTEKKPCPSCSKAVSQLPRHLKNVHGWSREEARKASDNYGLRKRYTFKMPTKGTGSGRECKKSKDYHKRRHCPIDGCYATPKRLSAHLNNVHKMKAKTSAYKDVLKRAKPVMTEKEDGMSHAKKAASVKERKTTAADIRVDLMTEDVENENEYIPEKDANDIQKTPLLSNEEIFAAFGYWMESADGGKKEGTTSSQHKTQVEKLLERIDESNNISSLFNVDLIQERFLFDYAPSKFAPGTIKSYLTSVSHFCDFWLIKSPQRLDVGSETIRKVKDTVKRWATSYRKECGKRKWQRMEEELAEMITPENVNKFERSKVARDAVSTLGLMSGAHNVNLTQQNYTTVRDFLLIECSINNASRSGCLANMKVSEFSRARQQDGSYVVAVHEHKTAHVHGPAQIVLSSTLYGWMKVYMQEVRTQIPTAPSNTAKEYVFLTWNGESMSSGQISNAMNSVWRKAGQSGNVSATGIRKAAVSIVHTTKDKLAGNLADMMAHDITTARKHYRLVKKKKVAAETSQEWSKLIRTEDPSVEEEKLETDKDKDPLSEGNDENQNTSAHDLPKKTKMPFTQEQLYEIRRVFKFEIVTKTVTMDTVRSKIQTNYELENCDPRRVYDRIRSEWRATSAARGIQDSESQEPPELPNEKESLDDKIERMSTGTASTNTIPPTQESGYSHAIFNSNQIELLKRLFPAMINGKAPISKKVIENTREKSKEAAKQFLRVSTVQIVNRLKFEKRNMRK